MALHGICRSTWIAAAHGAPQPAGHSGGGADRDLRVLRFVRALDRSTRSLLHRSAITVEGMRNWYPLIAETMEKVRDAGVERIAAVCLAPQFSELSVGLYIKRTEEAKQKFGVTAEIVWAKSFHDEPLLVEAFAERLRPVVAGQKIAGQKILFTAHSLPEKALASGDPRSEEHTSELQS